MEITLEQYEEIGNVLHHGGMTDKEIDEYFAHYGVKGMRWGKRGTRRAQKRVDRLRRVSAGNASRRDKVLAANSQISINSLIQGRGNLQKSAGISLDKAQKVQDKMNQGKRKVTNMVLKFHGLRYQDLDFSHTDL